MSAEFWILARKPLQGTVAANVARWGTGGLNIDGCRIATGEQWSRPPDPDKFHATALQQNGREFMHKAPPTQSSPLGRWPANLVLSPDAAAALDEQSGEAGRLGPIVSANAARVSPSMENPARAHTTHGFGDAGGASRFFAQVADADLEKLRADIAKGARMTDRVRIHIADAATAIDLLEPCSIDALVTDPPAGIAFMGKAWDSDKGGREQWVAWLAGILRGAHRALKPGAHALVWALPRTAHWTMSALEDAGFEIRDVVTHLFGTGFPKSLDVSKAIDAAAGVERAVIGRRPSGRGVNSRLPTPGNHADAGPTRDAWRDNNDLTSVPITAPATPDAARWQGFGTALKPAAEFWVLARKPLEGTVAGNVLKHGTGGLNIDGCRVEGGRIASAGGSRRSGGIMGTSSPLGGWAATHPGRWPANLTLDEDAAAMLDEQSGHTVSQPGGKRTPGKRTPFEASAAHGVMGLLSLSSGPRNGFADTGGASRFFYTAKVSTAEREWGTAGLAAREGSTVRNFHPTVKPLELMRWLVRLITPPGGTVLDLFAGSGSTGIAALAEGFRFVGFEQSEEYAPILKARIAAALQAPPPEKKKPKAKPPKPVAPPVQAKPAPPRRAENRLAACMRTAEQLALFFEGAQGVTR
jgi:site-specific DNA-methyltransferase (adenine-specific)